jgi:hypothetical protein
MAALPLDREYEKPPDDPLPKTFVPPDFRKHRVKDGEDWWTIAAKYGIDDPWDLIVYNFKTRDVREVNWYLRERVGCDVCTYDRKNWKFTSSAQPGIIYVPSDQRNSPLAKALEKTWIGVGVLFGGQVGKVGRRLGIFTLVNVEHMILRIPAVFKLMIDYTLHGIGLSFTVQQALIVVTGVKNPSKINGMVILGGRVSFDFGGRHSDVRRKLKRGVRMMLDNLKTLGVFFTREQISRWMKQLDVNIYANKPRVHVIGDAITGFDASASISVGTVMILG